MQPTNRLGIAKPALKSALLGFGFDGDDGHTRLTRGNNFLLFGGSQDTHGRMQETAIKVNEELARRGKRLEDVSPPELFEILHKLDE